MAAVHAESHGIYGSQKIATALEKRDDLERPAATPWPRRCGNWAWKAGFARRSSRRPRRPDPDQQPAAEQAGPDFTADAPNRKWVTDITYLATAAGWVYLAVVIDLFSRKVVGWA